MTTTTRDTIETIGAICERFETFHPQLAETYGDRMPRMMDIEAAYESQMVDVDRLLGADDSTFLHDVAGIHRHTDRRQYPGVLADCFLPRCAP